jgi:hypothetical protein
MQSIIALYSSSLFLIEKLMKFVSTSTRKGGPKEVLYLKNMPVGTASLGTRERERGREGGHVTEAGLFL